MHSYKTGKKSDWTDLLVENTPRSNWNYIEEASILNWNIENPDVCNIAVVARYGAGKSSAVNTYLTLYRGKDRRFNASVKSLAKACGAVDEAKRDVDRWIGRLEETVAGPVGQDAASQGHTGLDRGGERRGAASTDLDALRGRLIDAESGLRETGMDFDMLEEAFVAAYSDLDAAEGVFDATRKECGTGDGRAVTFGKTRGKGRNAGGHALKGPAVPAEGLTEMLNSVKKVRDGLDTLKDGLDGVLSQFREVSESRKENARRRGKTVSRDKNEYARVSLASFNNGDAEEGKRPDNGDGEGLTGYDEGAVERGILQQLLYSRGKKYFPNSKIRRTDKTGWYLYAFPFVLVTFLMAASLYVLSYLNLDPILRDYEWGIWARWLFLTLAVVSLAWIVFDIAKFVKGRSIVIKDLEIRSDNDGDTGTDNLISRFVDEVIYFFRCTKVDLVVFEDLDRWGSLTIFSKLRELNSIINSDRRTRKVTFLYAVKSDMFKDSEERAKFFDYILYIVPVVNSTTSGYMLKKYNDGLSLCDGEIKKLSDDFVRNVSVFIPDMRVLNNAFDDYVVMYKKILKDGNHDGALKQDNLFALCLYKNLFPRDYELLENDDGLIHDVFCDTVAIQKRIDKINVLNKREKVQYRHIEIADVLEEYGIDAVLPEKYDDEKTDNERPGASQMCSHDNRITDDDAYVHQKKEHEEGAVRSQLTEYDKEARARQIRYLRFIILHGYMDENYYEYVTRNKSRLSESELNLICRIRANETVAFDSQVEHIDRFINELTENEFDTRYVMIKPILIHVDRVSELSRVNKDKKYDNLVGFFKNMGNHAFIREILANLMNESEPGEFRFFLQNVVGKDNQCMGVFHEALKNGGRNSDALAEVLMENLYESSKDGSRRNHDCSLLTDYVAKKEDCTGLIDRVDVSDKRGLIDLLSLKTEHLSESPKSPELQRYIIEKGYYVISIDNLKIALGKSASTGGDAFFKKNYHLVKCCPQVKKYIEVNIDIYIDDVWLNTALTCEDESEDDVAQLLMTGNNKAGIIIKHNKKFDRVKRNYSSIYNVLIENDAMVESWQNILTVFHGVGYDGMRQYLSRNAGNIREQNTELEKNLVCDYNSLVAGIIKDEDSKQEIFERLPSKFSLKDLDGKKLVKGHSIGIVKLIKADKVVYSAEDYGYVCDDPELLTEYVAHHNEDIKKDFMSFFVSFISSFDVSTHDEVIEDSVRVDAANQQNLARIIENDGIGFEIKHGLISEIEKVGSVVIKRHEIVYANYIIKNASAIMSVSSPAEIEVLWRFKDWRRVYIERGKNTVDKKFNALAALDFGIDGQSPDDFKNGKNANKAEYLSKLGGYLSTCSKQYKNLFTSGCDTELIDTDKNRRLLEILKACGVIEYTEYENEGKLIIHVN